MALPTLLVAVLAGCYNPDLAPGKFACDETSGCPEGQQCINKLCQLDPNQPSPNGDMGVPPGALMPADGCSKGGIKLTSDVSACKGSFDKSKFRDLCSSTYHVCGERGLADGRPLEGVQSCPEGFYALSIDAWFYDSMGASPKNVLSCNDTKDYKRAIAGCGKGGGSQPQFANDTSCRIFFANVDLPAVIRTALVCENQTATSNPWRCKDSIKDAEHKPTSEAAGGGVLCCRG